jgi:cytochrome c553
MKAIATAGLAFVLAGGASTGFAADAELQRLTTYVCATCHGVDGNSTSSAYPKLAGQQAVYIEHQLQAFKERKRDDPPARAYMYGFSSQLTPDVMKKLAAYYAAQAPMSAKGGDDAAMQEGKAIWEEGLPQHAVPACKICHGANAEGKDFYPRLAGQYPEYLLKQMLFFQSATRSNAPIMHGVTDAMNFAQMQAVANYAASRR